MKQLLNHVFFLFIILISFNACQQDSSSFAEIEEEVIEIDKQYPNVDSRLWPFFEQFETEAKLRGFNVNLNLSAISGSIDPLEGEHVAGQCTYSSRNPNHVTVDDQFWSNSNDLFKEFIIFHELGHCFLGRGHREGAFANGVCKSLMRSGVEDCLDNYRTTTRSAYIDELFEPNKTP